MKAGIKMVILALIFNGTDILSGVLVALKTHKLVSSKLRDGMFKKAGFLLCYFLAWLLDNYGSVVGFSVGFQVLPAVVGYAILTEVVSVIENVSQLNPDLLPEKMLELFHINKEGEHV